MDEMTVSVYRGDGKFEDLIKDVFVRTGAGRVTLRLRDQVELFPVYVEARRPDVEATGDYPADPNTGTFRYLESKRQPLVQNDTRTAEDAPPQVLIERYGVGAQILAPIVARELFQGIISVHHVGGARSWTPGEIAVATEAAATVAAALGSP